MQHQRRAVNSSTGDRRWKTADHGGEASAVASNGWRVMRLQRARHVKADRVRARSAHRTAMGLNRETPTLTLR